jgi:hypothetical protein
MKNALLWERRAALRACSAALLLAVALVPMGCKRPKPAPVQLTVEEAPRMASTVRMGDAAAESQLLSGFYGIESGAWRWTGKQFTVALRPPAGAAQKGATLEARFTVPDVVIAKLKNITVTASMNGQKFAPETYSKAGEYTYKCDAPAAAFKGDSVKVEFSLDKAMPPGGGDIRELGIVALSIGLTPK